ncbi:MAG: hypothetical protein ACO394_09700 [Blastocatellia bacterium]
MDLARRLRDLLEIIDQHPSLLRDPGLTSLAGKLDDQLATFTSKAMGQAFRNTAAYADLVALLAQAENRLLVTADWMSGQSPIGTRYLKNGKKEKEQFAIEVVKAGVSSQVIQELNDTPRREMEELLHRMALGTDAEVKEHWKTLKAAELKRFCQWNQIPVITNPKGAIDKTRTFSKLKELIAERREYTKLTLGG